MIKSSGQFISEQKIGDAINELASRMEFATDETYNDSKLFFEKR